MKQITLSGKVLDRPQIREIAKARSVARFSLVVAEGGGTTWHTVVGWGATADQAKAILPGDTVTVEAMTEEEAKEAAYYKGADWGSPVDEDVTVSEADDAVEEIGPAYAE